jgi:hypothetical protein
MGSVEDDAARIEYVRGGDLSEIQEALRIGYSLRGQLPQICSQIIRNITTSTRMIDDLPSVAIKSLLEYSREQDRLDRPTTELDHAYQDVRRALLRYSEVALQEAKKRERRLLKGITSLDKPPDESRPT